ncbi:MAG: DegT/DnrJ/EryC1/StrS aminotransferase family protein, partial [Proteobacteria bacterium]|nr:DegT/DnrJ/EryC1/StrS aminotransferase family protein [Pseudomonadota bacterium]
MPEARDVLPWLEEIDRTRWYTNGGPLVRELEAGLVELVCSRFPGGELHGVAVSSGTTALALGLAGLGMGVGHRVMLPALTFPATAIAVRQVGSREVLVDVDPDSWSLTPDIARAALRHVDVDLVVPVAAFGRPQSVDAWDAFIEETGVPVLIDAAAAFGSQAVGRH